MRESYSVGIDANTNIIFPKQCVLCGKPCEETGMIRGNPDLDYWGGWKYLFGLTMRLEIFAHKKCLREIQTTLRLRNLVLFGLATLTIPIIFFIDLHITLKYLLWSVLALFIIFQGALWQAKNPGPIEFAKDEDQIKFTFENEHYATQFAHLNGVFIERIRI